MNLRFRMFATILAAQFVLMGAGAQPATAQHATSAQRIAPLAPGERIPNLDQLKNELKQYQDCTCKCGCYAKDLDLQADRAIAFLRARTAKKASAEKLALVLDIDETTLSNYPQMLQAGFAYDAKAFSAWIDSAQAPAIPGTLRLFNEAKQRGVAVFFLTGRTEDQRTATEKNLHQQGFDGWERLILRQPDQKKLSALEYKSAERAKIQKEGFRMVLNVGDQWSDLRGTPQAEYSAKYPDPYYFLK